MWKNKKVLCIKHFFWYNNKSKIIIIICENKIKWEENEQYIWNSSINFIIASAKVFEKAGKEASRKYIHIMLSNWWIIAMVFFDNMFWAAATPLLFVIVNYLSYKKGIIKVMERDDKDENKESLGTVYYALSLFILALLTFGPLYNPIL